MIEWKHLIDKYPGKWVVLAGGDAIVVAVAESENETRRPTHNNRGPALILRVPETLANLGAGELARAEKILQARLQHLKLWDLLQQRSVLRRESAELSWHRLLKGKSVRAVRDEKRVIFGKLGALQKKINAHLDRHPVEQDDLMILSKRFGL